MTCKCGSENVTVQIVSETKLKQKHRGLIYWVCIGWWWRPILWFIFTVPMLIIHIFRPAKYKTKTVHKKKCVCQACGRMWSI